MSNSNINSFDFTVNNFLMKLLMTANTGVVKISNSQVN